MHYDVVHVTPLDGHMIDVTFRDGKRGVFDMSGYLDLPIFRPLRNVGLFACVKADHGTATWPGDIDIAPERLYTDCVPVGEA